jgi:hypothetical protein
METIKLYLGCVQSGNGGIVQDNSRPVEFIGEELAGLTNYGTGRNGGVTDTRGVTQTLYRTEEGDLVVHIKDWSRWQGEPTTYDLVAVTEEGLQPGGQYEALGREAGMGRPLTLQEALATR